MATLQERFRFLSKALPDAHALRVLRFRGQEGFNMLYSFEILLATQQSSLPLEEILAQPAKFIILREDNKHACFSGYPTKIVQTSHFQGWTFYTVTLQPAFWKYTQIVQSAFFINKDIQEIIQESLDNVTAYRLSYEFRLNASYSKQEFSMQHNESIYDYLSYKMERDGISYYFEEQEDEEHLVFSDNNQAFAKLEATPTLTYSPTSGLETTHLEEVISEFSLQCTPLPQKVILRDYDWLSPNQSIEGSAEVSRYGLGEIFFYGEGFSTSEEGDRLAQIRAESLRCQARVYSGLSSVPTLRPGFVFTLNRHYDPTFNRSYLLTSVQHEGSQEAWLSKEVGVPIQNPYDQLFYRNRFSCIEESMPFRPARVSKRAKVSGMLTAFIDASTNTGIPEINEYGCYKVVFPQDTSGRSKGKASCWLRRMQSHVGASAGTLLPLAAGVEVMISFLDGDPDRPFIAGAVSNTESGAVESAQTTNLLGIRSTGQNNLLFNDTPGKPGVLLNTGGRSGLLMNSGSTDVMLTYSDTLGSLSTTSNDVFAGIGNSLLGTFENTLKVDNDTLDGSNVITSLISGLQKGASGIGKSLQKDAASSQGNDPTSMQKTALAGEWLSRTANGIKTALLAFKLVEKYRKLKDKNYACELKTTKTGAKLDMQAEVSTKAYRLYIAFATLRIMSSLASPIKAGLVWQNCKNAERISDEEKKIFEELNQKTLSSAEKTRQQELAAKTGLSSAELAALYGYYKKTRTSAENDEKEELTQKFNALSSTDRTTLEQLYESSDTIDQEQYDILQQKYQLLSNDDQKTLMNLHHKTSLTLEEQQQYNTLLQQSGLSTNDMTNMEDFTKQKEIEAKSGLNKHMYKKLNTLKGMELNDTDRKNFNELKKRLTLLSQSEQDELLMLTHKPTSLSADESKLQASLSKKIKNTNKFFAAKEALSSSVLGAAVPQLLSEIITGIAVQRANNSTPKGMHINSNAQLDIQADESINCTVSSLPKHNSSTSTMKPTSITAKVASKNSSSESIMIPTRIDVTTTSKNKSSSLTMRPTSIVLDNSASNSASKLLIKDKITLISKEIVFSLGSNKLSFNKDGISGSKPLKIAANGIIKIG